MASSDTVDKSKTHQNSRLVGVQEEALCMDTDQIHTLEIDLADRPNVNGIRIFQLSTERFSPLWFAASWQGTTGP